MKITTTADETWLFTCFVKIKEVNIPDYTEFASPASSGALEDQAAMLKFIRGKGTHISAERVKVQKELFGFSKVTQNIHTSVACSCTNFLK